MQEVMRITRLTHSRALYIYIYMMICVSAKFDAKKRADIAISRRTNERLAREAQLVSLCPKRADQILLSPAFYRATIYRRI